MTRARVACVLAGLALIVAAHAPRPAAAADTGGAAALVEKEFFAAIKSVTPAAVYCVGKGGIPGGSSGVIISRDGYILSDGDAGVVEVGKTDGKGRAVQERVYPDEVEIRLPDLKRGTYSVLPARVVRRIKAIDSTLLLVHKDKLPSGGLPFVVPGTSASLEIGQFTFAMGTPFGQSDGGTAALTAGVVAALVPAPEGQLGGRVQEIETTAAINPGVNGGPLVDVDGNLVGIISSWGEPSPVNPFQFLGKAYPIDRIRAAYRDLPNFGSIFPDPKTLAPKSKNAALLERAIALAARRAAAAVVSLEIERSAPFRMLVPQKLPKPEDGLARYAGPVSGVSVSKDGFIVSSLYNFANTMPIVYQRLRFPNDIDATLAKITSVTAHYADGTSVPAKVVATDQRLGLVCLKAEWPAGKEAPVLEAASATDAMRVGRLLVAVGNPFGRERRPDPLVTVGMLSRLHPESDENAWRGDLQTDAGMTDGNCGGALVDVHGRIVALATLWDPAQQGRESGIGFGVPWFKVEDALPSLEKGVTVAHGFLGVSWAPDPATGAVKIMELVADGPAAKAGLKVGDTVVRIDGKPVAKLDDAVALVRIRNAGDKLDFTVERGTAKVELSIVLGKRP